MSNAWLDEINNEDDIKDCEKKFEDNFVPEEANSIKEFQKLDDSEEYLSKLGKFRFLLISQNLTVSNFSRISFEENKIEIIRAEAIAR